MPQNYMNNFYNPYPQYQYNPNQNYMDRLVQFQQAINPQMQNQNFAIMGKIAESIDIVRATDIPMDGNMYYFPKADGSEIYAKQWLPNGTTRIVNFKPVLDAEGNNSPYNAEKIESGAFSEVLEGIQNEIKMINEKIDRLGKVKSKKEGSVDE